jgi:hypothetical protein
MATLGWLRGGLLASAARRTLDQRITTLQRLAPRWFVIRNAHASSPPILMQPRFAMALLRGPMTRSEIRAARGVKDEAPPEPKASGAEQKPPEPDPWAASAAPVALR